MHDQLQRRPIKLRSAKPSLKLASLLAGLGVTPNQVSVMSMVFSMIGALLLVHSATSTGMMAACELIAAAMCIQLRLLCNMVDGLIAVEYGKSTRHGDLFNEFPDRLSDVVVLVSAGYAAHGGELAISLGWLAALLAVLTAYIRAFAARYAQAQDYSGPMAKPHRMFALTVGAIATAVQTVLTGSKSAMLVVLIVICAGTLITCIRRTAHVTAIIGQETC